MIEILKLLNFQKHKKLVVHLNQPITTIVGPTDKGKSSILRALRWALTNQPAGLSFISTGESRCRVDVHINGHLVSRRRSKTDNRYYLDKEEYKAFGAEPPAPICELVNVDPDVNIQQQHNPYFWLTLNGSQINKELNKFVSLEKADKVVAWLSSKSLSLSMDYKLTENRRKEAAAKRKAETIDVSDFKQQLKQIDKWVALQEEAEQQLIALDALQQELKQATAKQMQSQQQHDALVKTDETLKQADSQRKEVRTKLLELEVLDNELSRLLAVKSQSKSQQQQLQSQYDTLQKGICPLCQK